MASKRMNLGLTLGALVAAGCATTTAPRPAATLPETGVVAGEPNAVEEPAGVAAVLPVAAPAAIAADAPAPESTVAPPADLFGDYAPLAAGPVSPSPRADESFGPKDNQLLVTLNGTFSYVNPQHGDNNTSLSGNFEVGWFLKREHEIGGQLFTNYSHSTHFDDSSVFLGPYYNYNWYRTPRQTFYGGPHLGLAYYKVKGGGFNDDETSFAFGVHGGWRQWLTPTVSFNIEPRYTHTDLSNNLGGNRDEFDILFGFSVIF